jgi:thiamine-monophosphate kinase
MTSLTEFELIERYFARPARARAVYEGVRLGIGDDCALLAPSAGHELAVSSDMLIEGRHFLTTVDPMHLGHKALAVNLSDLAACGAKPLAFTLAMALPEAQEDWLARFSHGLFAQAAQHHIALVGGDTTKSVQPDRVSPGPLCLCITVMGEVPQGAALLRSGAQVGDDIYVSGTLGDARLALGRFLNEWTVDDACFAQVRQRMEQPTPRVALGMALRGMATSAIDVSDGFVGDLKHILTRSSVGAHIDADTLPRSNWMMQASRERQRECTLNGGDDYELIFTAPASKADAVQAAARQAQTAVKKVGRITADKALVLLDDKQQPLKMALTSFDHFA